MKRGQFNWTHYTLRFLVVALVLTFYIMTYRVHEGKNFLDTYEEKINTEDLIFFDMISHHCFSPSSLESGRKHYESFDFRLFTQERLATCIPLQSRVTLAPLFQGETNTLASSATPFFQPDATQQRLVLVNDKIYIITMELQHA